MSSPPPTRTFTDVKFAGGRHLSGEGAINTPGREKNKQKSRREERSSEEKEEGGLKIRVMSEMRETKEERKWPQPQKRPDARYMYSAGVGWRQPFRVLFFGAVCDPFAVVFC